MQQRLSLRGPGLVRLHAQGLQARRAAGGAHDVQRLRQPAFEDRGARLLQRGHRQAAEARSVVAGLTEENSDENQGKLTVARLDVGHLVLSKHHIGFWHAFVQYKMAFFSANEVPCPNLMTSCR